MGNFLVMKNIITVLVLVLIAGVSRLIPHPWNFTAVGAMALFAGSRMSHKGLAFLAPFLCLLWTDAVLGFHSTMVYVYGAVALTVILGMWAQKSWLRVGAGALLSSMLFFVLTNFGVWFTQGLYPHTWEGLVQSYVMALPFFQYQVGGEIFYSVVIFGAYELIRNLQPSWVEAQS